MADRYADNSPGTRYGNPRGGSGERGGASGRSRGGGGAERSRYGGGGAAELGGYDTRGSRGGGSYGREGGGYGGRDARGGGYDERGGRDDGGYHVQKRRNAPQRQQPVGRNSERSGLNEFGHDYERTAKDSAPLDATAIAEVNTIPT